MSTRFTALKVFTVFVFPLVLSLSAFAPSAHAAGGWVGSGGWAGVNHYADYAPGTYYVRAWAVDVNSKWSLVPSSVFTVTLTVPPITSSCSVSRTAGTPIPFYTGVSGLLGDSTFTWAVGKKADGTTLVTSGGTGTGYTYTWSGTGSLTGTGATVAKTYTASGDYTASVTVTDSAGNTKIISCSNRAYVRTLPDLTAGATTVASAAGDTTGTVKTFSMTVINAGPPDGAATGPTSSSFPNTFQIVNFNKTQNIAFVAATAGDANMQIGSSKVVGNSSSPYTFTPGTYYVRACANVYTDFDFSNNSRTPEINDNNNCGEYQQVVIASPKLPDLTAGATTVPPSSGVVGSSYFFFSTVANDGLEATGPTTSTFPNLFEVRTNDLSGVVALLNTSVNPSGPSGLAVGAAPVSITSSSYTFTAPGTYKIHACANAYATGPSAYLFSNTEQSYFNNCGTYKSFSINCPLNTTWSGSSCLANVAIGSFTSSPTNPITYNTPATLSWSSVTGGGTVTCSLNNGLGAASVIAGSGSKVTGNLTSVTTTFTLTCGNSVGPNAAKSVTVTTTSLTPLSGICSSVHYACTSGTSVNNVDSGTTWTWRCNGENGGANSNTCSETKTCLNGATDYPTCTAPLADTCGGGSGTTPQNPEPTGTSACGYGTLDANSPANTALLWKWSCGTVNTCSAPKYGCTVATDTNYNPSGPDNTYGCAGTCANGRTEYPSCISGNQAPSAPSISGPITGAPNTSYTFSFVSIDPEGNTLKYQLDWDNNGTVDGSFPQASYVTSNTSQSWTNDWGGLGAKTFKVRAVDSQGASSEWASYMITLDCPANFTWKVSSSVCVENVAIGSFTASPANPIPYNTPATLSWNGVTGGGSVACSIDNGLGSATPTASGNKVTGSLTTATTFVLTCQNYVGPNAYATTTVVTAVSATCAVAPGTGNTSTVFNWTTSGVSGGNGSYTYAWSGTDSLTGSSGSIAKSYATNGTKTASVIISSAGFSKTFTCTNSASVSAPDSCGTGSGTTPQNPEPTGAVACTSGTLSSSPVDTTLLWKWSCGTVSTCSAPKYGCITATDTNYNPSGPDNTYGCSNTCLNGASNYPTCTAPVTDACGGESGTTPQNPEPTGVGACGHGTLTSGSPADTSLAWNWSCGTVNTCSAPKYGCTTATDTNYNSSGPNNTYNCALTCANGATNYPVCVVNALSATCTGTPANPYINQPVTWVASVGSGSGSYTYSWSGDESLSGATASLAKSYTTVGVKHATVTVTDTVSGTSNPVTCTTGVAQPNGPMTIDTSGVGVSVGACASSLSVNPITVEQGNYPALTWSVTGGALCASSCSGGLGFNTGGAISGTAVLPYSAPNPPSTSYSLTCTAGTYGPPPPANATVAVTIPAPLVTVNNQTINSVTDSGSTTSGSVIVAPVDLTDLNVPPNVTIVWAPPNGSIQSCSITKNGVVLQSGLTPAGTITDKVAAKTTYVLDCKNAQGAHAKKTIIVNILLNYQEF